MTLCCVYDSLSYLSKNVQFFCSEEDIVIHLKSGYFFVKEIQLNFNQVPTRIYFKYFETEDINHS